LACFFFLPRTFFAAAAASSISTIISFMLSSAATSSLTLRLLSASLILMPRKVAFFRMRTPFLLVRLRAVTAAGAVAAVRRSSRCRSSFSRFFSARCFFLSSSSFSPVNPGNYSEIPLRGMHWTASKCQCKQDPSPWMFLFIKCIGIRRKLWVLTLQRKQISIFPSRSIIFLRHRYT
jgi:hypothetical protein